MDVLLRKQGTNEVFRVGFYEFQARIEKGEISPDDEVKDNVLTKNEWWPARDLRLFHRLSSTACEPGHRLRRRNQVEQEEREAYEAAAAERAKLAGEAREFFRMPESTDEFVLPVIYQFLRLHEESSLREYKQAVRFSYFPSFHPPLFVRVSSIRDEWELAAARGHSQASVRKIRNEVAADALELAGRAKLFTMPAEDSVFGLDGASWMIELADKGNYVVRKRWSPTSRGEPVPELTPFVALAKYMAGLSELLKQDERMY